MIISFTKYAVITYDGITHNGNRNGATFISFVIARLNWPTFWWFCDWAERHKNAKNALLGEWWRFFEIRTECRQKRYTVLIFRSIEANDTLKYDNQRNRIYRNWDIQNIFIVHIFFRALSPSAPLPLCHFILPFFHTIIFIWFNVFFVLLIFMIRKLFSVRCNSIWHGAFDFKWNLHVKKIKINDHRYESSNVESWSHFVRVCSLSRVRIIHSLMHTYQWKRKRPRKKNLI